MEPAQLRLIRSSPSPEPPCQGRILQNAPSRHDPVYPGKTFCKSLIVFHGENVAVIAYRTPAAVRRPGKCFKIRCILVEIFLRPWMDDQFF